MAERKIALCEIAADLQPATVRGIFYQASVHGVVEKSESGYGNVQRALVDLRISGRLPWHYIADNTRWQRKPRSFSDPSEALRETARLHRKALWADADDYVEIWIEKDALSAVIYEVTEEFDVPLMVARGFSSVTFLQQAAADISDGDRPAHIYHLGDFDPSGVAAANKIEESLSSPDAEIHFTRLAVLPWQIKEWALPTRPTKRTDSRAKGFGDISVELDAIDPHRLRSMVRVAIERHLPGHQLDVLRVAEASEREMLTIFAREVAGGLGAPS